MINVSQFAKDNNVYFEFYQKFCLVKDILTKETLLQGREVRGLYQFNVANSRNSANKECNVSEIKQRKNCEKFDVWHCKLRHPSVKIVRQILHDSNISVGNIFIPCVHLLPNEKISQASLSLL